MKIDRDAISRPWLRSHGNVVALVLLHTAATASAHNVRLTNSCADTVWVGILNNGGFPLLDNGGFQLDSGASRTVSVPTAWEGRFWGRTGCTQKGGSNQWTCETGDCGGNLECQGLGGRPPATLAEFTFDADCCGGIDFYDVSLVDGYNLPMSITPLDGTFRVRSAEDAFDCGQAGCVADLNDSCPSELELFNSRNDVVACQSACTAFDTDEYCCRGAFDTAETCPPFDYSQIFKAACPGAYSYAYDDSSSLYTCLGTGAGQSGYEIEFCPLGTGNGPSDGGEEEIDCGCPSSCTDGILDRMATDVSSGSHSCRDRIKWLMSNQNMNQQDACRQVGNEFPDICDQGCHPDTCLDVTCGCALECSSSTLDKMATDFSGTFSCRERIHWLILNQNEDEHNACRLVASEFPGICDQGCNPDTCGRASYDFDCGCSGQCTNRILSRVASDPFSGSHTCGERIQWLMTNKNLGELDSCRQTANEFPGICDQGCHPDSCGLLVSDCGCPAECTDSVLETLTSDSSGTFSCRERINWVMLDQSTNEQNACQQVSNEFPSECGKGCDPSQCTPTTGPTQCPNLIWADEFDGSSLDPSKWDYQIGDGCDQSPSICGWGNNELQSYQEDNVSVGNGLLTIEARRQDFSGKKYTSGRIRTKGLADFKYGRFEARLKLPAGQGMWPAFWMLPTDNVFGTWPTSGEIDIVENIGREPYTTHSTIHYGPQWPQNQVQGDSVDLVNGDRFSESFHDFAVEWKPNELRWTMDGHEILVKKRNDVLPYSWPFEENFHMIINLAVGGNWPGPPDAFTVFPQQLQADFIRVYDSSFGRLTGPSKIGMKEQGITYTIDDPLDDYVYTWEVPEGASIVSSNPGASRSITVDFGESSGYVVATATSAKCNGVTRRFSVPVHAGGRAGNCGCADTCTETTLDQLATDSSGTYSCKERINWLITHQELGEIDACAAVANEFPSICGQGCSPGSC